MARIIIDFKSLKENSHHQEILGRLLAKEPWRIFWPPTLGYNIVKLSDLKPYEGFKPWVFYIQATKDELIYRVIDLKGEIQDTTIPWKDLPLDFPQDEEEIVKLSLKQDSYLALLGITAKRGHTPQAYLDGKNEIEFTHGLIQRRKKLKADIPAILEALAIVLASESSGLTSLNLSLSPLWPFADEEAEFKSEEDDDIGDEPVFCYEVLAEESLGQGGFSDVFPSLMTLTFDKSVAKPGLKTPLTLFERELRKIHPQELGGLDLEDFPIKKPALKIKTFAEKPRVIKVQKTGDEESRTQKDIKVEHYLTLIAGNKIKPPSFVDYQGWGLSFLVMEYLAEFTLADLFRQRKAKVLDFSAEFCLSLSLELLKVCHSLFERGLIHRDIKPGNILILNADGLNLRHLTSSCLLESKDIDFIPHLFTQLKIKLIDFGLSCLVNQPSEHPAGTLAYMAPEAFKQGVARLEADLFSLGLILVKIWRNASGKNFQYIGEAIDSHLNPSVNLGLFQGKLKDELDASTKARIEGIIKGFLDFQPKNRPKLADAITIFTKLLYDLRLKLIKEAYLSSELSKDASSQIKEKKLALADLGQKELGCLLAKKAIYAEKGGEEAYLQVILKTYTLTWDELEQACLNANSAESLSCFFLQEALDSALMIKLVTHKNANLKIKLKALEHDAFSPEILEVMVGRTLISEEEFLLTLVEAAFGKIASDKERRQAWEQGLLLLLQKISSNAYLRETSKLSGIVEEIAAKQELSLPLALKIHRLFYPQFSVPTLSQFKQSISRASKKERTKLFKHPLFSHLPDEVYIFLASLSLKEGEVLYLVAHQHLNPALLGKIFSSEITNNTLVSLLKNPSLSPALARGLIHEGILGSISKLTVFILELGSRLGILAKAIEKNLPQPHDSIEEAREAYAGVDPAVMRWGVELRASGAFLAKVGPEGFIHAYKAWMAVLNEVLNAASEHQLWDLCWNLEPNPRWIKALGLNLCLKIYVAFHEKTLRDASEEERAYFRVAKAWLLAFIEINVEDLKDYRLELMAQLKEELEPGQRENKVYIQATKEGLEYAIAPDAKSSLIKEVLPWHSLPKKFPHNDKEILELSFFNPYYQYLSHFLYKKWGIGQKISKLLDTKALAVFLTHEKPSAAFLEVLLSYANLNPSLIFLLSSQPNLTNNALLNLFKREPLQPRAKENIFKHPNFIPDAEELKSLTVEELWLLLKHTPYHPLQWGALCLLPVSLSQRLEWCEAREKELAKPHTRDEALRYALERLKFKAFAHAFRGYEDESYQEVALASMELYCSLNEALEDYYQKPDWRFFISKCREAISNCKSLLEEHRGIKKGLIFAIDALVEVINGQPLSQNRYSFLQTQSAQRVSEFEVLLDEMEEEGRIFSSRFNSTQVQ